MKWTHFIPVIGITFAAQDFIEPEMDHFYKRAEKYQYLSITILAVISVFIVF